MRRREEAVAARRRALPLGGEVRADYVFESQAGRVTFAELFAGAPRYSPHSRRQTAGMEFPRAVVLVEGVSDKVALETLAVRRGRDLAAEGVSVVAIGGAQAIGRFLNLYGPRGSNLGLAGFCDAGEERAFGQALERAGFGRDLGRAGMERLGFFVCERDLEDELVR